MLTLKMQILTAAVTIGLLVAVINRIRRKKLELKYALAWLLVGIVILIFDIFPGFMNWLSALIGVFSPVNMVFFLGFCFSLILLFLLTNYISKLAERVKKLTQRIAILEEELRRSEDKNEEQ